MFNQSRRGGGICETCVFGTQTRVQPQNVKIPKHDDKNPRGRRDVKERAESEDITAVEEMRLGPRKNKQGMVSLVGLQEREEKEAPSLESRTPSDQTCMHATLNSERVRLKRHWVSELRLPRERWPLGARPSQRKRYIPCPVWSLIVTIRFIWSSQGVSPSPLHHRKAGRGGCESHTCSSILSMRSHLDE